MNRTIFMAALALALGSGTALSAQEACAPDQPKPRSLIEALFANPGNQEALAEVGLADVDGSEISLVAPSDSVGPAPGRSACGAMNGWSRRVFQEPQSPRGRMTFYRVRDRYIAIQWMTPAPAAPPGRVRVDLMRRYAWIFDNDLNRLVILIV